MQKNTREENILSVLDMLYPKIQSVLQQTHKNEREDLQQILVESIIKKMTSGYFESGESLIDLLNREKD
ncbi:hypothetical protein VQL36_16490 [Chengkuizengella sp. SCS-71B]|uniref:hypothetical protein n=1 Tax=Chengkuizengella sp. SCS-71B TaxID=3115290 RepID=UPI0032C245D8